MARLVLKHREVTEEPLRCEASTMQFSEEHPKGLITEVTVWVGESYIKLNRLEMLKLKSKFDKLLKQGNA